MQNCYGLGNVTCKTGVRVTGTNPDNGQPITAIPIQSMYNIATLDRYVSYMSMKRKVMVHVKHDMASKLWGGETYYMQGVHISNSCTNGIDCILMKLRRHNPIPRQY